MVFLAHACTALAATAALLSSTVLAGPYTNHQLVRVSTSSSDGLAALHALLEDQLGLDVWNTGADGIDVRIAPEERKFLGTKGPIAKAVKVYNATVEVLEKNIQEIVDKGESVNKAASLGFAANPTAAAADWFSAFHTYDEIKAWYQALATNNPTLVTFVPSIGKSRQGRDLFAVKITSNKNTATKKTFFFQGLIHAREWISGSTVQWVSNQLVSQYASAPTLLDTTQFVIVPIVNPDGYVYTWGSNRLWRKNRASPSGVDLNRNYDDGHWGQGGSSSSTSSDTYRGPSAGSEPETQAVQNYFLAQTNLVGAIDFHSYSQLVLRPLGWTSADSPDEAKNKVIGDGLRDKIYASHQVRYTSQKSIDLYVTTGTSTDFWYNRKRIYAFCIELRPGNAFGNQGFVIDPKQIVPTGEEIWAGVSWWVQYALANPLPTKAASLQARSAARSA
ncbi:carboxypeptidase A1-like protein [Fimicolochytrium jonesii]|uniref:carboxypeptidase A1-like protein n=1 Tax=Fimicolochytrium jonesii TaxID=1396493 RepID=UPI0022FEA17A|nr:carboxypeptidase A1-like protein [Fimicolochytrium jonesii]KAI8817505.1 carboxypeptidase A1-like protein [Fimicolochytrium jonesii]